MRLGRTMLARITSRRGHGSRCRAAPAPRATAYTAGRLCVWTTTAPRPTARRPALAHGPPQPHHRRAGLLPLLHAPPVATGRPGSRRRPTLDGGGAISDRQGPCRPGSAPGPPLALLVPLGHPCHARPRLPGGGGHDRTRPTPTTVWADPDDLQRDPAPIRGPGHPARRRCRPPVALVGVATPTPSTRPYLPLPTTGRLATMKITIYG
jgi:hypothetical protein